MIWVASIFVRAYLQSLERRRSPQEQAAHVARLETCFWVVVACAATAIFTAWVYQTLHPVPPLPLPPPTSLARFPA